MDAAVGHVPAREVLGPIVQRDTWSAVAFLLLTAPAAVLSLVVVAAGLLVGTATALIGVGLPVLIATLVAARELADLDRRLVNTFLGGRIAAPVAATGQRELFRGNRTWRALAWLVLRGLTGLVVLLAAATAILTLAALVALPFVDGYLRWGDSWRSSSGAASAWAPVLAVPFAVAMVHLARAGAAAHRLAADTLLGPDQQEQVAALQVEAGQLQERTVLARDLHDGIGHALTVMVLQAEAGLAALAQDQSPGARTADRCLHTVADTGRRALGDLESVLVALHCDDAPSQRPGPALSELPELLERARDAGLPLQAEVQDAAVAHPAGAVAYRIVQEACTNAMRHAGRAPTIVRIETSHGWLRVEVRTRPGPPDDGLAVVGGRGLAGLAERVRLAGGEWSAGRVPDGDWVVAARLPPGPG